MQHLQAPRDRSDRGGSISASALEDWAEQERLASAIPKELWDANIQLLEGDAAQEYLLGDKLESLGGHARQYVTGPVQRLLDRYDNLRQGIWAAIEGVPYAKPIEPRPDLHKLDKRIKYETAPGQRAAPLRPTPIISTLRILCNQHGLDFETSLEAIWLKDLELQSDGLAPSLASPSSQALRPEWLTANRSEEAPLPHDAFWAWWQATGCPIAITEGFKKALSLLAHGIPAIAIRGITQWHLKGGLELHPEIEPFVTKDRKIYIVFDQDTKPKTVAAVHQQARQLGTLLQGRGCNVFYPVWNPTMGKGIDDVLSNWTTDSSTTLNETQNLEELLRRSPHPLRSRSQRSEPNPDGQPQSAGDNAINLAQSEPAPPPAKGQAFATHPSPVARQKLGKLLGTALSFKDYKRGIATLWYKRQIQTLSQLTFPIERQTEGEYLPPLPPLTPSVIHVIDATMNTGKTYRIGRDWVQTALAQDKHVLVLSPLNALGQQTAKDWGILHIHDQGNTGQSQRDFWQTARAKPGLVLCPDSISKLPEWFWSKPVVLVVDEGNQVTEHISQGDTLKSRYADIVERVASAAQHAIASGGAIVLSEDGIPDRAVQFWQQLSGTLAVRCFQHRKQGIPWDCQVFSGKASGFRKRLLDAIGNGERLLFVTSSQREAKRLDRILEPQCNVTRIDSETNESGAFNLFFKDPDQWLRINQPDVLILSPSAKSGVSIEGKVAAEDAYFDAVWAYFPALATDTHLQLLGRYRPPVPRHIFIQPFITKTADESLGYPKAIKQRLNDNLVTLARLFDISTGDHAMEGLEVAILDYLKQARTVSGSQKSIAQVALIDRLEASGHTVDLETLKAHQATTELWQLTQEQIWLEEAVEIALARIEALHTLDWAHRTLDSMESSREARIIARKVLWREQFPGVTFDDTEECYEAFCKDYGAMHRGVLLQARAANLEAVKQSDRAVVESILSSSIRTPHRLPKTYIKAAIIAKLGLLDMLDGTPWTNADKRAIAIKQMALKYRSAISYWLDFTINEDQTPCEIVNKLMLRLGLKAVAIGRPGTRSQKRGRVYAVPELENPLRLRLLNAAKEQLAQSVSAISNEGQTSYIEMMDTPQQPTPEPTTEDKWQVGDLVRFGHTLSDWVIERIEGAVATLKHLTCQLYGSISQPIEALRPAQRYPFTM